MRISMLAAAAGAALIAASATAATIEVRGSAGSVIAAAILRAAPGDTIHLPAATFVLMEPIRPKSGVKLIGEGIEKSFIVYAGGKPGPMIEIEGCQDLEIAQFRKGRKYNGVFVRLNRTMGWTRRRLRDTTFRSENPSQERLKAVRAEMARIDAEIEAKKGRAS